MGMAWAHPLAGEGPRPPSEGDGGLGGDDEHACCRARYLFRFESSFALVEGRAGDQHRGHDARGARPPAFRFFFSEPCDASHGVELKIRLENHGTYKSSILSIIGRAFGLITGRNPRRCHTVLVIALRALRSRKISDACDGLIRGGAGIGFGAKNMLRDGHRESAMCLRSATAFVQAPRRWRFGAGLGGACGSTVPRNRSHWRLR